MSDQKSTYLSLEKISFVSATAQTTVCSPTVRETQ